MKKKISDFGRETEVVSRVVVCPDDTNPMGLLKGGRLLQWMDNVSAICAQSFSGLVCVTAFMNNVKFLRPARNGEMITIKAKVKRTFNTSMEIYVEAWSREVGSDKDLLINEGDFTFVAINSEGRPVQVPAL